MKVKFVMGLALVMVFSRSHGQTFNEWFRQKKTQIKYLGEQILALQNYAHTIEQGYSIAKNGLTLISDIKSGDFSLHSEYFQSLSNIKPEIASYSKVAQIIALQTYIVKQCATTRHWVSGRQSFSNENKSYCTEVLNALLMQCLESIDELTTLLSSGTLQLKDDERLKRIDDVYETMKERSTFLQHFNSEVKLLSLQRKKESLDDAGTRLLYGIGR